MIEQGFAGLLQERLKRYCYFAKTEFKRNATRGRSAAGGDAAWKMPRFLSTFCDAGTAQLANAFKGSAHSMHIWDSTA